MKKRNKNQEVNPKHQKQVHEKKRQNILWKQRNISNKYDARKRIAFKDYATRKISDYNAEIEKKVESGLFDEEKAGKLKDEFSHKIDTLIPTWSEAGEKRLKEIIEELYSPKEVAEPEENSEVSEMPKEVQPMEEKKRKPEFIK
ncbi:Uncharacterised protein [uncultured archaeon]|nr:Uncharacterised protein [uncultured archaeon]